VETAIDIDALCAPLSDDNPCGDDPRDDVRFDSPYQELRNRREEAMTPERGNHSAMDDGEAVDAFTQQSNWQAVVDQAASILEEHAKDLEVCALLIEGLVRTHGIAGMRDGMTLTARLVRDYWGSLNPPLDPSDPDSLEDRIAAFNGLDGANQPGTVARHIPRLPITGTGYDDFLSYQLAQAYATGGGGAGAELQEIEDAARKSPMSFYVELIADVESCQAALADMDAAFTEMCGYDGPSTSRTREALESLAANARAVGKDHLEAAAQALAEASEDEKGETAGGETGSVAGAMPAQNQGGAGPVQSRSDALKRLRLVADYFRETEPHSPLSYSLENLMRWANLPLNKLIEEWIPDEDARDRFRLMTGMPNNESSDEDDY
jgi:type VI secretion system protein ImpA